MSGISFISPSQRIQRTNRLRILCLNTLEGTSFVVQVEGTSTWVIILRTREDTSLADQFKWRVHPLGSCKGFYKVKGNLKDRCGCLGTGCRHGLLSNKYKNLCLFSSSLRSLISAVHFSFTLYFCLSYCFDSLLSHNLVVKPNRI